MAGNYPDPPNPRLPYDEDGTLGYLTARTWPTFLPAQFSAVTTALPEAHLRNLNDETSTTKASQGAGSNGTADYYLIFPTPRTLTHLFVNGFDGPFQWSTNTSNGIDGTWTAVTGLTSQTATRETLRTNIVALPAPLTGVKAVRWTGSNGGSGGFGGTTVMHLYGYPTSEGDRLVFWHPTLDQPLSDTPAYTDWADVPRGTAATRQVRVKNQSAGLTASDITIGVDELTPTTPSLASQTNVRYAGGAYGATTQIAALSPGEISDIVEVQIDLSVSAALGLASERLTAQVESWT